MHRYYDRRLFDVDSEQDIIAKHAPEVHGQPVTSCRTAQELASASFDVRAWGSVVVKGDGDAGGGALPADVVGVPRERMSLR